MVMNQFIEKNYLFQHIKNCIEVSKERHDLFKILFKKHVKTMHIQEKPFSSFHIIGLFNEEKSIEEESEIIKLLKQHQISVYPLSKCYVGTSQKTGLIFGFSAVRTSVLKRKIILLTIVLIKLPFMLQSEKVSICSILYGFSPVWVNTPFAIFTNISRVTT